MSLPAMPWWGVVRTDGAETVVHQLMRILLSGVHIVLGPSQEIVDRT